ncbi:MAG: asparagine synthase [Bacteroidales bacterium]|nr:asparagine synthase [Bacteroidales bacterium]
MEVKLLNNGGKLWVKFGESYVKGFAFIGENLLNENELYNWFVESIKQGFLSDLLLKLNGNFSAVINDDGATYLIADKLKSYPLLYMSQLGDWVVTDQAKEVLESGQPLELNERAILTYLSCGYLHGDMTIVEHCHMVMAGSYVKINEEAEVIHYHRHIYAKQEKIRTEEEILKEGVEVMDKAFLRMIKSIGDRPIFIPLSGGYDSRLLACLCRKFNIPNVSCFTYGDKISYEVVISEQVAKQLGFPWYYVEYTDDLKMKFLESDEYNDYMLFAMNLNTTSHIQDFIAFRELRKKGIVPDNAVIIPGHSGDALGGSHIEYNVLRKSNKSVAQLLIEKYYTLNVLRKKYKGLVFGELEQELNDVVAFNDVSLACSLFDNWNIQNRQANFIVNAVRVYEYLGVDWRIPLWDDELSDFWLSMEWEQKCNQVLYDKYMFKGYFIPLRVAIYKKKSSSMNFLAKLKFPYDMKGKFKYWLSTHFKVFKKYYDPNNFYLWVEVLKERLDENDTKFIRYLKNDINALAVLNHMQFIRKILDK